MGYLLNGIKYMVESPSAITRLFTSGANWLLLGMAGAFFLSAFYAILQWLQPLMFLIMAPISILQGESFYGLGAFVIAMLLLFRLGFFNRHRVSKLIISLAYLYVWEIIKALQSTGGLINALMPVFFITAFLLMLYFAYQEKIMVYLKEPKERLSLADKGLSAAEKTYVLALIKGLTPKEIAAEYSVSDSTVRNTLSRAYQKLGVPDRAALLALATRYEVAE